MAESRKKLILLLELPPEVRAKLAPLVDRSELDTRETSDPAHALGLLQSEPFDLLVIAVPLGAMELRPLIKTVRQRDCASKHVSVLLIGEETPDPLPAGVNRAVPSSAPAEEMRRQAADLLSVQPRADVRALVKVEVALGDIGTAEFIAQSRDISTTGMLVRSIRRPSIGSRLPMRLEVPGTANAIKALVEVVRHADRGREGIDGFAVRFVDIDPVSLENLQKIIQRFLNDRA